jgi:glutamate 5-kinase
MQLRAELKDVRRLVIKVGSNVVTKPNGKCDLRRLRIIVEDICELQREGFEVVLVSSGAVNVGRAFLEKHLPNKVVIQQCASAIGQPKLINRYSSLFEENGSICSQILLTHDDFRNQKRFLHAKETISTLLRNNVIPILNENDTISYTDISVGDNDHLAAQAAQMVDADLLLIITTAKGLYDKDPAEKGAKLIKYVSFGDRLDHIDMTTKTAVGRGGMSSKIDAVSKATHVGVKCIISSKDNERIVLDALTTQAGTLFDINNDFNSDSRKAWLISTRRYNCFIDVTREAYEALLKNKSLLSDGIIETEGCYSKGDCVDLRYNGETFAVGMCEFDKTEVDNIKNRSACEVVLKMNLVINGGMNEKIG